MSLMISNVEQYSASGARVKRILLIILSLLSLSAGAHNPEQGQVWAAFGPYLYQTQRFHEQFESPLLGGWSLIAEGDLTTHGGLELTLAYMNPIFAVEREDKKVIERVKRMYIAMGWRHWFSRDFSVSPSFFSSYVMGDAKIVRNDFGNPVDPPHTSARDPVDYGFALSTQYEALHYKNFAVLLDARYSYSVTPKPKEDSNTYGLFVAVKFFIQGKPPEQVEEPDQEEEE